MPKQELFKESDYYKNLIDSNRPFNLNNLKNWITTLELVLLLAAIQ